MFILSGYYHTMSYPHPNDLHRQPHHPAPIRYLYAPDLHKCMISINSHHNDYYELHTYLIHEMARVNKMCKCDMDHFWNDRKELDERVMRYADTGIKRFYRLDSASYEDGALPARTKELLGLVASFVLRCDDCIRYHLKRCHDEGVSDDELAEALGVGLVVGGSVTIPHLHRAFEAWESLGTERA